MGCFRPWESWLARFELEWAQLQAQRYPMSTRLHEACRYALAGQGKRIRPLLAMASADAAGSGWESALPAAMAVECIHTYSLVHDDLPCMDNDDWRRGRPTTHKVYGEATALLAGDALLTDAFAILLEAREVPAFRQIQMVRVLSEAAGGRGMVFGQDLDMHWTGRNGYTAEDLDGIHLNKTGALITAACTLGGLVAGVGDAQLHHLRQFGQKLGLAFQIIDDLLDESSQTGKTRGKDVDSGKLTYLSLMSRGEAERRAEMLTREAEHELAIFANRATGLRQLAEQLLSRKR